MRSKNRLSFIANVYHLFFWFRVFVRFSLLGKSLGNHCNSQSWESEVWCIFHRKKYIYEMTHSLHVLCPYFSDAMETEDKAGSSPAGKTVEVVSLHFQSFNSSDIRLVYIFFLYVFKIEGWAERPELKNDQNIKWRNGHWAAPSVPHSKQQHRPDDSQKHKGEKPALMIFEISWCHFFLSWIKSQMLEYFIS